MHWVLLFTGLAAGLILGESMGGAVIGGLVGYAIGLALTLKRLSQEHAAMLKRLTDLDKDVKGLQGRLAELAASGGLVSPGAAAVQAVQPDGASNISAAAATLRPSGAPSSPPPDYSQPAYGSAPGLSTASEHELVLRARKTNELPSIVVPAGLPRTPATPASPAVLPTPSGPTFIDRAIAGAKAWLFGGNTVLRVGLVLLFLGLAFLLRYATEGMDIPVEARYAGVAAAAVALIGLGWWLRRRNENYALLMQGGGIAVMYLTVFAAMRLHPLLSSGMALGLLVAVTVFSAMLAVLQNALGLAAAAALGGFAAPILTSTGAGNHVALFTYFALLNAGIFAIAWFKAWRLLNLIGFVGTFGIGFAWGLRSYTPDLFASTEPFLVLFFLMYVGIGLLFARRKLREAELVPEDRNALLRWAVKKGDYIDGTLLFGVPVVGFALQFALIRHLEFGPAFSALALGLFYMGLARVVSARSGERALLMVETCLALGVIFGTLAIPLGLDARWTSAAWAVEGAGVYWLGLRQGRPVARGFGLLLQLGAALMFLAELRPGDGITSVLSGVPLGALMLGAALLASFWNLRQSLGQSLAQSLGQPDALSSDQFRNASPSQRQGSSLRAWDAWCRPVLAALGCFFLYLLPPLLLGINATAMVLALAGLATLFLGLRLGERSLLFSAFGAQLGGGALFAAFMRAGDLGSGNIGWGGLLGASMIGLSLVGGMVMASRDEKVQRDAELMRGLAIVLLVGLVFLNLAVLYILPWQRASAVWAGSGLLILWLSLHLRQRASFVFGLLLQGVGGISFLGLYLFAGLGMESPKLPIFHAGFLTPLAISVAALIGAWRLQRGLDAKQEWTKRGLATAGLWRKPSARAEGSVVPDTLVPNTAAADKSLASPLPRSAMFGAGALLNLSYLLMLWGAMWWALAFVSEAARFLSWETAAQGVLLIAAGTTALWAAVARRTHWLGLGLLSSLLVPAAGLVLAVRWDSNYHLAAQFGWLAWLAVFVAHGFMLRQLSALLPKIVSTIAHVLGCWLLITVLSLELRYVFILLSDSDNAWRWLGWALAPSLFLFAMALPRAWPWPWPVSAAPDAYRLWAPLPVAVLMLAWFWVANIFSNGAADPLPYLPLINPLELGMLFALLGCYRWASWAMPRLGAPDIVQRWTPQLVVGASLFALFTAAVFRTAHHWADVPFALDTMLSSMLVQAGLSIVWTTLALALMIFGHLRARREMWLIGAVLIGVVVAKLFFVELSNQGGLARIVSFIGVGVLLLVVGYFAPLPPRRSTASTADALDADTKEQA